jgi:hypothetical protein
MLMDSFGKTLEADSGYEISEGLCSLKAVARQLSKCKLGVAYRKSDGTRLALNQQVIVHFSLEMGMIFVI